MKERKIERKKEIYFGKPGKKSEREREGGEAIFNDLQRSSQNAKHRPVCSSIFDPDREREKNKKRKKRKRRRKKRTERKKEKEKEEEKKYVAERIQSCVTYQRA